MGLHCCTVLFYSSRLDRSLRRPPNVLVLDGLTPTTHARPSFYPSPSLLLGWAVLPAFFFSSRSFAAHRAAWSFPFFYALEVAGPSERFVILAFYHQTAVYPSIYRRGPGNSFVMHFKHAVSLLPLSNVKLIVRGSFSSHWRLFLPLGI